MLYAPQMQSRGEYEADTAHLGGRDFACPSEVGCVIQAGTLPGSCVEPGDGGRGNPLWQCPQIWLMASKGGWARVSLLLHFGVLLHNLGQVGCACVIVKLVRLVFQRWLDILTGVVSYSWAQMKYQFVLAGAGYLLLQTRWRVNLQQSSCSDGATWVNPVAL